jgi:hypothetical protein
MPVVGSARQPPAAVEHEQVRTATPGVMTADSGCRLVAEAYLDQLTLRRDIDDGGASGDAPGWADAVPT